MCPLSSASRQRRRAPTVIRSCTVRDDGGSAVVSRRSSKEPSLLFLSESIALALDHQGMAVMQQAIEDRGRQDVVAEDRAPLRHDLVGGDQQAAAFVPAGDELEKEMSAASLERQVAELVDDEQLRLRVKHQAVAELSVGFGFRQRRQERGGAGKEYRVAGFDDGAPERDREMRLPDAGRAEDEHVFGLREKARRRELAHEALIDRGLEFELEVIEGLHRRKVRDLEAHGDASPLLRIDFLT